MVHLAAPHEVASAVRLVNAALAGTQVTTGVKIELGFVLLLTGLAELSLSCRAHVTRCLVSRLAFGRSSASAAGDDADDAGDVPAPSLSCAFLQQPTSASPAVH